MRVASAERKISGFTLVEMAIVLVIIGIILAGVMKGRDIVRGAQVKQFSQQFAQKWATVAQTYYDKTGQFLNDGTANGGLAGAANGQMDGGVGARINAGVGTVAADSSIIGVCEAVGITPCALIKSKITTVGTLVYGAAAPPVSCQTGGAVGQNLCQTMVEGEFAGTTPVDVDLVALTIQYGGSVTPIIRNCVTLTNVPTDVAAGLDTAIDGTVNGAAGSFINIGTAAGVAPNTAVPVYAAAVAAGTTPLSPWPSANTSTVVNCAIVLDY